MVEKSTLRHLTRPRLLRLPLRRNGLAMTKQPNASNTTLRVRTKPGAGQKGQALVLAVVFLALGSMLTLSILNFARNGTITSSVYAKKVKEIFAADAGARDAAWQIKYDYMDTVLTNPSAFSLYDFNTHWSYLLGDNINDMSTNVTIDNLWIPSGESVPNLSQAQDIIQSNTLLITSYNATSNYVIKASYMRQGSENITVQRLGLWLPTGYRYVSGSSNLGTLPSNTTIVNHAGGQAIIWTFNNKDITSFPGVNPAGSVWATTVTFNITSANSSIAPSAVAWIATNATDIPVAWDANINVYKITSKAGGTTVITYIAKTQSRVLSAGISGDFRAVGNSLMRDVDGTDGRYREVLDAASNATIGVANNNSIPADATVRVALLYWSGWKATGTAIFSDSCSNFNNWNYGSAWSISSGRFRGGYSSGGEAAKYLTMKNSQNLSGYAPGSINITWSQSEGGTLEPADILYFNFSANNGTSWSPNYTAFADDLSGTVTFNYTIPDAYLTNGFKIRFYLSGFDAASSEYAYLDNFTIATPEGPDTTVSFMIDGVPVWFAANGTAMNGTVGAQDITASSSNVDSTSGGYSFVCKKDVTELIKKFTANGTGINHPGNAVYTVGGVAATPDTGEQYQLAYAGWSLVVVFTSGDTKGHSLYLYDPFLHSGSGSPANIDFDFDGQPGGTITGFLVPTPLAGEEMGDAAKLTVFIGEGDLSYPSSGSNYDYLAFNGTKLWDSINATYNSAGSPNNVWNGKSVGMAADGVDIDTFHITWASGLLPTGATSAKIDLPSNQDQFNLIYIIIAFRSDTKSGGNLVYEIH